MALTQVKTSGIADDAVTTDKMASGTDGRIISYDASGNPTTIGPGTDGQVLTSTGAGSPPAFENAAAGGAALTGSTNNTVCTVTGANAIQGEANLTYDGTTALLKTTSDGNAINVIRNSADANPVNITLTKSRNATYGSNTVVNNADVLGEIVWKADDGTDYATEAAAIRVDVDGAPGGNDMPSRMEFFTTADGGSTATKRLTINNAGNVQVEDGNLQILTAGHGVEFSAFGSGTGITSNLLDDYEEGTFTPTWSAGVSGGSYTQQYGHYVKNGNVVNVWVRIQMGGGVSATSSTLTMTMPFTAFNNSTNYGGTAFYYQGFESMDTNLHVWVGSNSATLQFHNTSGGNFLGTSADAVGSTIYFHTVFRTA